MTCRWRSALLLSVAVLFCPAAAAAEDGRDAFTKALSAIWTLADDGKGKAGLQRLSKLLEGHARKPYVLKRRNDLENLVRLLALAKLVKAPPAKDVVSGELMHWNPDNATIKIAYTPDTARDLKRETIEPVLRKRGLVHPARWFPPVEVRIEGRLDARLLKESERSPFVVFGEWRRPRYRGEICQYQGIFEYGGVRDRTQKVWGTTTITAPGPDTLGYDGEVTDIGKAGNKYTYVFKVTKTRVTSSLNGIKLAFKRPDKGGLAGPLVFHGVRWSKVTFSGSIDKDWILKRVDAEVEKQRKAFRRTFRPAQYLPAWLFEKPDDSG